VPRASDAGKLVCVVSAAFPVEITLEEWAALPEDEPGELVDGALEDEEVPDATHEIVVAWLLALLRGYLLPRGGMVMGSGLKLGVLPRRGRMGDVVCYFAGRRPPKRGLVRLPPDVVVEVVSPSPQDERRDRVQKPGDYAAFGVRWYWLVDPELRTFEVWELGADGRYVHARAAERGTVADVPGCEGLLVDLDALWAEVAELADE
jgi:Uma2 family endonuclease